MNYSPHSFKVHLTSHTNSKARKLKYNLIISLKKSPLFALCNPCHAAIDQIYRYQIPIPIHSLDLSLHYNPTTLTTSPAFDALNKLCYATIIPADTGRKRGRKKRKVSKPIQFREENPYLQRLA